MFFLITCLVNHEAIGLTASLSNFNRCEILAQKCRMKKFWPGRKS